MGLSLPHILLFALIAVLLLGGGRFSALMGDVAKGVKQFKKGMAEDDEEPVRPATPRLRSDLPPEPVVERELRPVRDERPRD